MSSMPYEKTSIDSKYGHYDLTKPASYTLTNGKELRGPWYYVYSNRKILLYVDQNGPVKIQYQPPSGILVAKREWGESDSKWQVWVQSPDLNGGIPVSNFNSPKLDCKMKEPKFTANWSPSAATYTSEYDNVDIITEIFVPSDKATVSMKTTIKNKSDKEMDFTVRPAVFPYVNIPQMVAWDLPEWYLSTKTYLTNNKMMTIHGQMSDPGMDKNKERSVTFNIDFDENAEFEIDMSKFAGPDNFLSPAAVKEDWNLSYKMPEAAEGKSIGWQRAVWTAKYNTTIKAGESKTFTQVLTVQDAHEYSAEENEFEASYFDDEKYLAHVKETDKFYESLFTKRTVKTENELFDSFMNNFAPLQMYWVGSLDRGWPSSMRGTRDASQDFTGMLPLDPVWTKEVISELFEHQRKEDGWFPRQISTISRTAPHDMRFFCDGGAFLLELVHEYMAFTRDVDFLFEKYWWLETDEKSTVLEHILKTVEFFIREEGIGEHDLCKVWYGDWWDTMDGIGMEGRGETVTVTAQMIYNLKNLADMFKWLVSIEKLDKSYLELAEKYMQVRERFLCGMKKHAYNSMGYFNGYFNDNGKWLLADYDADGEEGRLFLVSNAWGIIGGAADKEMKKSVLKNIEERCYKAPRYLTRSKGYAVFVDKAGRVGNGKSPGASSYNHAQSFLVRAACAAGDPEMAYKATRGIYPIEDEFAPCEQTFAPPFCIANSYSASTVTPNRVQLQYLSGTVSYVLRNCYSYFFGITYGYEGLELRTCMPKAFGECSAQFEYLGKKFTINCHPSEEKRFIFNGSEWDKKKFCEEYGKDFPYIADGDMQNENIIDVYY